MYYYVSRYVIVIWDEINWKENHLISTSYLISHHGFFKELFFKQGNFHMKIQILLIYDIRLWLVDNIVCNPKENSINITMFLFVLTTNIMLFSKNKFLSLLFDRYIDEIKITSFDLALFWIINAIIVLWMI